MSRTSKQKGQIEMFLAGDGNNDLADTFKKIGRAAKDGDTESKIGFDTEIRHLAKPHR